jgi:hypothetical protein
MEMQIFQSFCLRQRNQSAAETLSMACVFAHIRGRVLRMGYRHYFARGRTMGLQPTEPNAAERTAGDLALNDVLYVALAIAVILFGNVALVRAMDVALDVWARSPF